MDFAAPLYEGSSNLESARRRQKLRHGQFPDVRRSRECPCAIRLYEFQETQDVFSRLHVAAAVLGVPPAIPPETVAFAPETNDLAVGSKGVDGGAFTSNAFGIAPRTPHKVTEPTVCSSVVVVMAWADTTLLELALPALEAVREDVDALALEKKNK
ncbi:unnamed protein product [Phytomonas sp. Hart1]|nr:unnamed protein product [Phytomonas sp. Hart1]|eukprot:CCW68258.1 unnamed protein product [Phytomonas sp. isolate Hart1]